MRDTPKTLWAKAFHEEYERLAPEFGYETRTESRTPWPPTNADLMVATAAAVLERHPELLVAALPTIGATWYCVLFEPHLNGACTYETRQAHDGEGCHWAVPAVPKEADDA